MRKLILLTLTVLVCSAVGLFSAPAAASGGGNCVTYCTDPDPCGYVCCFQTCCGNRCVDLDCAPPQCGS
jgi:hypothetical protein